MIKWIPKNPIYTILCGLSFKIYCYSIFIISIIIHYITNKIVKLVVINNTSFQATFFAHLYLYLWSSTSTTRTTTTSSFFDMSLTKLNNPVFFSPSIALAWSWESSVGSHSNLRIHLFVCYIISYKSKWKRTYERILRIYVVPYVQIDFYMSCHVNLNFDFLLKVSNSGVMFFFTPLATGVKI